MPASQGGGATSAAAGDDADAEMTQITGTTSSERMASRVSKWHARCFFQAVMNKAWLALVCAAVGCTCPDPRREDKPFAARASFASEIDACLAMDAACETLCRRVLQLDPEVVVSRCVITAVAADGVDLD